MLSLLRRLLVLCALVGILGGAWLAFNAWSLSDLHEAAIFAPVAVVSLVLLLVRHWITAVIAFLVTGGLFYYWHDGREKEITALRPMAAAAKTALEAHPKGGDHEFTLADQVLVWDLHSDRPSPVFYRLPLPLRAKPADQNMTVFLVAETRSVLVGSYRRQGAPSASRGHHMDSVAGAYRDMVDVGVVHWPDNRLIARHVVEGPTPPINVKHSTEPDPDVHVDLTRPIVDWILCIPTEPTPSASTATPSPTAPSAAPVTPPPTPSPTPASTPLPPATPEAASTPSATKPPAVTPKSARRAHP